MNFSTVVIEERERAFHPIITSIHWCSLCGLSKENWMKKSQKNVGLALAK
jgi:hypothetical protein